MNFSELNLHPAVAAALATRGYDTATPVQAAVLQTGHATRDMLISSQTGSGKTIAFGAALANTLLGPEAAPRDQRTAPIALVIVPTRELAVQVREELSWLLRDTGLRMASFTGGTAVTGDLRALQRGVDVGIGTPGRLVDLLRRQRLDLTQVRVVVLDEADEMLDLGFREDLEKLLQAAPEARQTLMLSATIPSEIRSLAKRFQRDALPIDPRKNGDAPAQKAHGDITYVAHLIAGGDRLAVVVNVLRAAQTDRAIVFCTTREAVSRLHAALLARGFTATAISGDRAQAERDRALEQVRRGDVRILVATNVAARGLHLPDVDLIIHADLPLNAESLTHRSGRTGRAGRKGTAVVIAAMSERRKAERLLSSAHVPVVWTPPPSAETITAAARDRLADELVAEAAADAEPEDPSAQAMVERLTASIPAPELARRLLVRELSRLPVGERVQNVAVPRPGSPTGRFGDEGRRGERDDAGGGRRPGRDDFSRHGVLFRVNLGAKDKAEPGWLLPLICRRGGVSSREVGSIRVGPTETQFEIAGDAAADFALAASERDPRAPHVTIERAQSERGRGPAHAATGRPQGAAPRPSTNGIRRPPPSPPPRGQANVAERSAPKPQRGAEAHIEGRSERQPMPPRATPSSAPAEHVKAAPPAAKHKSEKRTAPLVVTEPPRAPKSPPAPLPSTSPAPGRSSAPSPLPPDHPFARSPISPPPHQSKSAGYNPTERADRRKAPVPIIEMKRAPRPPGRDDHVRAKGGHGPPKARPDGMNVVKRSSSASPAPAHHNSSKEPSSRPPFWKEGARRRATPPAAGQDRGRSRTKPPER